MSKLITPFKGKNRQDTIGYTSLFTIKLADEYIKQCASGDSNDLNKYLKYVDKYFWDKLDEIAKASKDGKYEIEFKENDKYVLGGQKATLARNEVIEKLQATARFIYSLVRIYWDSGEGKENSLKGFIFWLPRYTNKLQIHRLVLKICHKKLKLINCIFV